MQLHNTSSFSFAAVMVSTSSASGAAGAAGGAEPYFGTTAPRWPAATGRISEALALATEVLSGAGGQLAGRIGNNWAAGPQDPDQARNFLKFLIGFLIGLMAGRQGEAPDGNCHGAHSHGGPNSAPTGPFHGASAGPEATSGHFHGPNSAPNAAPTGHSHDPNLAPNAAPAAHSHSPNSAPRAAPTAHSHGPNAAPNHSHSPNSAPNSAHAPNKAPAPNAVPNPAPTSNKTPTPNAAPPAPNKAPAPNAAPNAAPAANQAPAPNTAPNKAPVESPKAKEQTSAMWDVWFDHQNGRETDRRSPIVLDLNGNGKPDITGANITGNGKIDGPTTMFDLDPTNASYEFKSHSKGAKARMGLTDKLPEGELKSDGMWHYGDKEEREKTEWLARGGGDGLLAWDVNGDGKITSGKELFGEFDVDGTKKFQDGYQKLAAHFDKNHDGKVSGSELGGLSVWADANADGVTQEGELRSAQSAGIRSLDVSNVNRTDMSSTFTHA
ncbi:MAG: hypothetical protein AB1758_00745 [Candidatus Eremiobacterota bacterium]